MMKLVSAVVAGFVVVNAQKASDVELEHFQLLNELRAKGFTCPGGQKYEPNPTPLKFDCRLRQASYLHSEDMAVQDYFSHTSKNGRSPWDRAKAQNVNAMAENIAAGRSGAKDVLTQWENSDGHCRGMMNPSARIFGVGRAYNSGSKYRYYWTQMFGRESELATLDQSCLEDEPQPTAKPTLPPVDAPVSSCKDLKSTEECNADLACQAKEKKGTFKKCQKKKCKKIKVENTCVLVSHCKPQMKNGKFKKCQNA